MIARLLFARRLWSIVVMSTSDREPLALTKGANVALETLDSELAGVTVVLETGDAEGRSVDADVCVLLVGSDGRVGSNDDFVFYNQPVALGGAVHLRDTVRIEEADGDPRSRSMITLDLDLVPEEVARVIVGASIDPTVGATFGDVGAVRLAVERTSDGREMVRYTIDDATAETALLFGELYRRDGRWRLRAVGQGYANGLAGLAEDFGVDVAEPEGSDPDGPSDTDTSGESSTGRTAAPEDAGDESATAVEESPPVAAEPSSTAVSVRRPQRAPRMPAEWNLTVPVHDESDFRTAELFPIAGIGSGIEQERRAASSLLAVMAVVRDFHRALLGPLGAPSGTVRTYIEVPFALDDRPFRPDGLIRVTRGTKTWNALVEVKTASNGLNDQQIDTYVEIARKNGFDAVLTISNEIAASPDDHPVRIDRRKLHKVSLHHLSWDDIRTQAIVLLRHRQIANPLERHILSEFARYMQHEKSGLHGFTDMGKHWTPVRDDCRSRTLRANEARTRDVVMRFDQLVRHLALHLTSLLGVDVQSRPAPGFTDVQMRCQRLADSGVLAGALRVPGALGALEVSADVRADRVTCSMTFEAPREGRPATRVNWLVRQLPEARPSVRVEASTNSGRTWSTAKHLGSVRDKPEGLLPSDNRDIRSYRVGLDLPMGSKRSTGRGTLIGSIIDVTDHFYAEVVQNLRPWQARPPRMPQ